LALSKSFRTNQLNDLIHREFEQFHVSGEVLAEEREFLLTLVQTRQAKRLWVNNLKLDTLDYVGHFDVCDGFLYDPCGTIQIRV